MSEKLLKKLVVVLEIKLKTVLCFCFFTVAFTVARLTNVI